MKIEDLELLNEQPEMKFLFNVHESYQTKLNIINTHLIIEEILNSILLKRLKVASRLQKAQLRFHQKLHLAAAFLGDNFNENVYALLIKLNSIRNDYSHSLEPNKIEINIQNFINHIPSIAFETVPKKSISDHTKLSHRFRILQQLKLDRASPRNKLIVSLKWVMTELLKLDKEL